MAGEEIILSRSAVGNLAKILTEMFDVEEYNTFKLRFAADNIVIIPLSEPVTIDLRKE